MNRAAAFFPVVCLFTVSYVFAEPPDAAPPAAPAAQESAVTESEWPGINATISELKRTAGDTLTLKFVVDNQSQEEMDFGYNFGEGHTSDFSNIGGVHIIDPKNKKKYFVVRDSDGKCLCSAGLKPLKPSSKMVLWAKFPAPPAEVDKVSIELPHFIPIDDVPIR